MVHWLCFLIMPSTCLEWIYTSRLPECQETPYTKNRYIWRLSDFNKTRIRHHFVPKRSLNHVAKLAKWFSCAVSTYWYDALTVCFYRATYAFRVNLHSEIVWMSSNSLIKTCAIFVNWTWTHNQLLCKQTLIELCCECLSIWCNDSVFLSCRIQF